jgi:hypothetical protein
MEWKVKRSPSFSLLVQLQPQTWPVLLPQPGLRLQIWLRKMLSNVVLVEGMEAKDGAIEESFKINHADEDYNGTNDT